MEGASGSGSVHLTQQQAIQSLVEQGVSFQLRFGAKGVVTLSVLSDVQPTEGLKAHGSRSGELSAVKTVPLSRRSTSKVAAAKSKLKNAFPAATEKLGRFAAKAKKVLIDIKKAVQHENWKPIPQKTVEDCSGALKAEMQLYNESVKELDSSKKLEKESKKELSFIEEEYRDALKLYSDPQSFIKSKKTIVIPIPQEGCEPIVIKSSNPLVRTAQVNEVMAKVKESGLAEKIEQLERNIDNASSTRNRLKADIKARGNRVLDMYQDVYNKNINDSHAKNRSDLNVDSLARDQSERLTEFKAVSFEKQEELKQEVESLKAGISELKSERQSIRKSLPGEKKDLSVLERLIADISKKMRAARVDASLKVLSGTLTEISSIKQRLEEAVSESNSRIELISVELKTKDSELKSKLKQIKELEIEKNIEKQERSDAREKKEIEKKLARMNKVSDKEARSELDALKRQVGKKRL